MSLYFPRAASAAKRTRARSKPATSLTRLQAGMPQVHVMPAQVNHTRRRRRPHTGYTGGGYLARPRQSVGTSPRMFRVG